jgi:DNA-binding PadR family transcriptional regulator
MKNDKSHHIGTLSPEMALLGFLYPEPGHGYDLHRKVSTHLGQVWHLSQQGEISMEEIPQEKLRPRQLLRMTEKGRKRFLEWLEISSGGSIRAIRMEFITRLFFLRLYMPHKLAQAFNRQRVEAEIHIHRLEKERISLPAEQIYNCMSLDLRLEQLKTVLDWMDSYQFFFQNDDQ